MWAMTMRIAKARNMNTHASIANPPSPARFYLSPEGRIPVREDPGRWPPRMGYDTYHRVVQKVGTGNLKPYYLILFKQVT